MSVPEAVPLPAPRMLGLDAWRVVLMLGGLLLHGFLWQPPQPLFVAIELISHTFRMGTFFAISGFLCGLSMRKHGPGQWLARRFAQIGLPVLFGWGLLCPLIWLLSRWYPQVRTPLLFDWHHIWFMVALLLYAPAGLLLDTLDRRYAVLERLVQTVCRRRSIMPVLLGVSALSFILMASAILLVDAMVPDGTAGGLGEVRNIAGYLPEYLLGLAMVRSASLAVAIQRSWRSALAIVAATALLDALWLAVGPSLAPADQDRIGSVVVTVAASLCPPATFALIFRSATGIARLPQLLRRLCDASLTIYLLHLPLLLAANALLSPIGLHPYAQYALAVALVAVLSYAAHVWVVRPVPLLSVLVNGRIDRLGWPGLGTPAEQAVR